jgi:hypothetical protein
MQLPGAVAGLLPNTTTGQPNTTLPASPAVNATLANATTVNATPGAPPAASAPEPAPEVLGLLPRAEDSGAISITVAPAATVQPGAPAPSSSAGCVRIPAAGAAGVVAALLSGAFLLLV